MDKIAVISKNSISQSPLKINPAKLDIIRNKNILLSECWNSFMCATFPNAETLFIDKCEKNFVFYNFNTLYFPNVKHVYINCHPCESRVLHRHLEVGTTIHLVDFWMDIYKKRWSLEKYEHIKNIDKDTFNSLIASYELEELKF